MGACSNSAAVKQLKANGWNLEATLNQYFNDGAVVIDGDEGGESADAFFDRYKSAPLPTALSRFPLVAVGCCMLSWRHSHECTAGAPPRRQRLVRMCIKK